MKSISPALDAHLSGEVTTLCSCWKIVRRDGQAFYFTDHDKDIVFEGNTYEAESSYDRTAIQSSSDFSVDNLDVAGIIDSEKITDQELRAGLFNRADVYIFILNWKDPSQGALKVRRGWLGEVSLLGNGTFQSEIRGLAQALSHNFIEVFSSQCRADFCDARCKLNIADFQTETTVVASATRDSLTIGTIEGGEEPPPPPEPPAYRYWKLANMTGQMNEGVSMAEIQLRASVGGSALTPVAVSASNTDKNNTPAKAIDGNPSTLWGTVEGLNGTVWYTLDMGVPVSVAEIAITARIDPPWQRQTPHRFNLYFSADGINWTLAKVANIQPFNTPGQTQTVSLSSFTGNFSGDLAYGTVTFVDGENAGRVMEIIGFDEDTATIELFENVPYEIAVGTTVKVAPGCDKTLDRCIFYANVINRRAEDYIPGTDELVSYPDAQN